MDAPQERLERAKIKQLEKIAAILDKIERHLKALDPEPHKEVIENDDPFRVGYLKDGTKLNFTCDVKEGKLDEI